MNYIIVLCWLCACALQDAQQRKIANLLTLGGLAVALLHLLWSGSSLTGASPAAAALGMAAAGLLSLPGYLTRSMGAGDVKMLIALGAASDALHVLLSVIGAALVLIAWVILVRACPAIAQAIPRRLVFLRSPHAKDHPYAPFLLLGFAFTTLWLITQ